VEVRPGEPGMKRGHHRQAEVPRGERRDPAEGRGEPAVDVHHVDRFAPEQVAELAAEPEAARDPGERSAAVDDPAGADPPHEGLVPRVLVRVRGPLRDGHAGGDHEGGVAGRVVYLGQVVHVLGDATEVGIVELGDQRYAHRSGPIGIKSRAPGQEGGQRPDYGEADASLIHTHIERPRIYAARDTKSRKDAPECAILSSESGRRGRRRRTERAGWAPAPGG